MWEEVGVAGFCRAGLRARRRQVTPEEGGTLGKPGARQVPGWRWPGRAVVPQGPRCSAAEENGLQICAQEATGGFEGGLNKMSEGGNQVTSS